MDESAQGGEGEAENGIWSRVRVFHGIVPVRFIKLPMFGAQVALVVAMSKTYGSCRKL